MPQTRNALTIAIDRQEASPIYLQICERFKAAIAAGHLKPGDRVPALRGLATQLNTARGTVEMAYNILVDEGYLQMRGAAGTFVSSSLPGAVTRSATRKSRERADAPRARRVEPAADIGNDAKPLRPGLPALDAFPRKVWSRLVAYRARSGDLAALTYPDPSGYRPLRERIATYLGLSRGVECVPEQVFVTNGYRSTLELILRSLAKPEDRAWFEEPGYLLARNFLVEAGVRLVPVPIDHEGLDVDAGIALDADARFAFVTPSHHSPLGVTLALSRRMKLLDWASRAGSWIVEDDYDSEFRYVGRPLPALKSLDRDDRVIYCGTFSKVLFPGLRLSYVVAPERAVARFGQLTKSMNAGSPYLLQAAVADFIAQGHFARHLKRMRALYAERRMLLANAILKTFGDDVTIDLPTGGMHLVALFRKGRAGPIDDMAMAARAREAGLAVLALSAWYLNGRTKHTLRGIVVGFANVADAAEATRLARMLRRAYDG
ncbi:PLP-dependent aminotransferase family protein [Caballeronia novacaledonica]|uniref:PLP-dependent aminotransferase family protein n=1 Tax=Caballeronia novacaledonica TaxID=1544861 RepID=A0AA37IE29_9BURK|nr:PLP-dependent aminotransferase family protein [Caballeronia novacaledonica]GJH09585.1 PLP-dependent aminotransferase family protein [Caballeronia novacaledonica]GJH24575.1 PLP-dependent aminotransferase family protein [Caballeronia novacaledonica]